MKLKFIFVPLFLLLITGAILHPFNASVSDITYKDKKLHLKIKFFADDFQSELTVFCKQPIDIVNKRTDPQVQKTIQKYIAANFETFLNNGTATKWVYKQTTLNENVMYVEYESDWADVSKVKNIRIKNTLLFDGFPEQKNIVNINLSGTTKVLTFNNNPDEFIQNLTF